MRRLPLTLLWTPQCGTKPFKFSIVGTRKEINEQNNVVPQLGGLSLRDFAGGFGTWAEPATGVERRIQRRTGLAARSWQVGLRFGRGWMGQPGTGSVYQ